MIIESINITCPHCKKITLIAFDRCMNCNELTNPVKICEECGKVNMTKKTLCQSCSKIDPVIQGYKKRMNLQTYNKIN